MTESVLQRSALARWALAIPFGVLGLLLVALAPAVGLLSLPFGVLLTAMALWLVSGADDPPSTGIRWVLGISGGLSLLMMVAGVIAVIVNRL